MPTWPLGDAREAITVHWPARYGWENARGWIHPILVGLRGLVRVVPAEIEQPRGNIVVFEFEVDGSRVPVGIDYDDLPVLHQASQTLPLLFKLQHLRTGYGQTNVVPGGYVTNHHELYRQHVRFSQLRERGARRYDLYGRVSPNNETRTLAVNKLRDQRRFGYEGGLGLVLWSEYMRDACAARGFLDLPGRGPFCYRLVEGLAIGACVVGPRHETVMHVDLVDRQHITYCRPDLSDLVETTAALLEDHERQTRQGQSARRFFQTYLHSDQLAGYYLQQCLRTVGVASIPMATESTTRPMDG